MGQSLILSCFSVCADLWLSSYFQPQHWARKKVQWFTQSTTHILLPMKKYLQEGMVRFLSITAIAAAFEQQKRLHGVETGETSYLHTIYLHYRWTRNWWSYSNDLNSTIKQIDPSWVFLIVEITLSFKQFCSRIRPRNKWGHSEKISCNIERNWKHEYFSMYDAKLDSDWYFVNKRGSCPLFSLMNSMGSAWTSCFFQLQKSSILSSKRSWFEAALVLVWRWDALTHMYFAELLK